MLPVKRFTDFIKQNELFTADSKIIAAVSGGVDSVIMTRLLKAAGFNFSIAHCNFQLRGDESARDQQFCKQLAFDMEAPFYTANFDTARYAAAEKISIQMAARQLRYDWFNQLCEETCSSVIALAHHQNDAIETILLNLTRGTGIAGLHGILPKNGLLVRPLLFLNREEIQTLAAGHNLAFVEDSSNASAQYARNKIRLQVIPRLKELNPALEHTFEQNLLRFKELEQLLEGRVAALRKELFIYADAGIHLPLAAVKALEPKKLLLFNLLKEYGFNQTTISDLIKALDKHPGRVFETAGFTLLLDRDKLILSKRYGQRLAAVQINEHDTAINFGAYKLSIVHNDSPLIVKNNPMAVSVDAEKLVYPLTMRTWLHGDRFYPLGMKAGKKLSDFFINRKVPLHQKHRIPVLVNGNAEIVWVGGHRADERYKVTAYTKKVTIFELKFENVLV